MFSDHCHPLQNAIPLTAVQTLFWKVFILQFPKGVTKGTAIVQFDANTLNVQALIEPVM